MQGYKSSVLSKQSLDKLKKKVSGHYKAVAEKAKCSSEYVGMVLSGQRKSEKVIKATIEVIAELKANADQLKKLIQKI